MAVHPSLRKEIVALLKVSQQKIDALMASPKEIRFAQWPLHPNEIFFLTDHCMAFVNLMPFMPGHVLVAPARIVPRLDDLTQEELEDLTMTTQAVSVIMQRLHGSNGAAQAIQDGSTAGQTVPHVHFHIIPSQEMPIPDADDKVRKKRTMEEMTQESKDIQKCIADFLAT